MGLAAGAGHLRTRTGPRDAALREVRICYIHLAGERGIALYDGFLAKGWLIEKEKQMVLTDQRRAFVAEFGVDLATLDKGKAPLCRPCLDCSARRTLLADSMWRAMLSRMEELSWAHRDSDTRIVRFSKPGALAFEEAFGA